MQDKIHMVDLLSQYTQIKEEIDQSVLEVIRSGQYIKGKYLQQFEDNLASYTGATEVIGCANGTDALQIACMAAGLKPGDEVIVPAFTYVATAEVIALLQLKPVMVDVDPGHFNTTTQFLEKVIGPKTKAIVPVHLFGQAADMEGIMNLAEIHNLIVIEDNAQAIGSTHQLHSGSNLHTGTIGHIGCTSFYPSKNLGAFGDGGAITVMDEEMAARIRSIANHGQSVRRYQHDQIGCNSRLDAIQAAILDVKLKYLDQYIAARRKAAAYYDDLLADLPGIILPQRVKNSHHVFHQYTLKIEGDRRDKLQSYLKEEGIPSMVYYPIPLYKQPAYRQYAPGEPLSHTEALCEQVLSLPMHTELGPQTQEYIADRIIKFIRA